MKTILVTLALAISAPAYACNPYAYSDHNDVMDCIQRNIRELDRDDDNRRQTEALEDIDKQLRSRPRW